MIHELRVQSKKYACPEWWAKVPQLAKRKKWPFEPGLNILWGPNGSGKSTILLAMAHMFHCWQSGLPFVTQESLHKLFPIKLSPAFRDKKVNREWLNGIVPIHDGAPCVFVDPSKSMGAFGGAALDDSFMIEQISETMVKGSAGQMTGYRMGALQQLLDDDVAVRWKMNKDHVNSLWADRCKIVEKFLKGTVAESGPGTALLDEPDRSLDIPSQVQFWKVLPRLAARIQIIVATHSILAVNIEGANYIELEKGYLKQCREVLK